MTFLLKLLWYNDMIIPIIAFLCNVLLLFLLFSVNRNSMKQIIFALVPNCIIDILLSIATLAFAMQVYIINSHAYLVVGSPFRLMGFKAASYLTNFFGSMAITSMAAIFIPFYFRYLVICKNIDIKMKHILKAYSLLFLLLISLILVISWCFPPLTKSPNTEYFSEELIEFWKTEYVEGPVYVANKIDSVSFLSLYGYIALISLTTYGFVIYFSRSITNDLKRHASYFKETKIFHKQLHKALIYQAIGPFVISNVPILLIIAMFFLKIENYQINLFLSILLGWLPISNPIAAILIIKPYRNRVKELLGLKNSSTVVAAGGNPINNKNIVPKIM